MSAVTVPQPGLKVLKAQRNGRFKVVFFFLFPDLVVNLGDGSFPAATLRQLIDRAFAISLELVQVFVEDLAGAQSWNQVVKLPADFFRGAALFGPSFPLPLILKLVRNRIQCYWEKKLLTVITTSGVFSACVSHHRLHPGPPLLLILASLHVLEVLSCFGERLQEGVEDPEKLIRLHSPFFLPKVLQRFGKLHKAHIPSLINNFKHIETKCVIIQAGHEHMSLLFKFLYCHSCWKLTHTHTHTSKKWLHDLTTVCPPSSAQAVRCSAPGQGLRPNTLYIPTLSFVLQYYRPLHTHIHTGPVTVLKHHKIQSVLHRGRGLRQILATHLISFAK